MGNPDTNLKGGIPDEVSGYSTIRSQLISKTVALEPGDGYSGDVDVYIINWDAITEGIMNQHFCPVNNIFIAERTLSVPYGGCCAYIMKSGETPFIPPPGSENVQAAPLRTVQLTAEASFLEGNLRLIGTYMEAAYTGPEVIAKGSITQFSYPSYGVLDKFLVTINGLSTNTVEDRYNGLTKRLPPGDSESANKLLGAVERPAFDGFFQPSLMDMSNNKPGLATNEDRMYRSGPINGAAAAARTVYHVGTENIYNGLPVIGDPQHFTANEICGAYCIGLDVGFSLKLRYHVTVEQFPDTANTLLLSYAQPSPYLNYDALQQFNSTQRATKQFWAFDDNADGAYTKAFKRVLNMAIFGVARATPFLLAAVNKAPVPMEAKMAAGAALMANRMFAGEMARNQTARQARKQAGKKQLVANRAQAQANVIPQYAKASRARTQPIVARTKRPKQLRLGN